MPTFLPQGPCAVLQGLNASQFTQLNSVLARMGALRRLAELLEQAGNLLPLPDLSSFLPLSAVDLGFYNLLRTSCPSLNLPPASIPSLTTLQNQVNDAYSQIIQGLINHPWSRMGKFQALIDGAIAQANALLNAQDSDYVSCISALCQGPRVFANLPDATVAAAHQTYNNTIRLGGSFSQVLDAQKQAKLDQITTGVNLLNTLKTT